MMLKSLWLALVGVILTSGIAGAQTINIAGTNLTIPVVPGYCNSHDPAIVHRIARANKKQIPIALTMSCDDLNALKAGTLHDLRQYFVWMIGTTPTGSVIQVSKSDTRQKVIDQLTQNVPKLGPKTMRKGTLQATLKTAHLLERDGQAAYVGSFGSVGSQTWSRKVALITAVTEVKRMLLALNATGVFHGDATFSALLTQQKKFMSALLRDNPD